MCNLYSIRSTQEELRRLFDIDAQRDRLGHWPGKNAVFPDGEAPAIRQSEGGREMLLMRWGLPGPSFDGRPPQPCTNIRNVASSHWRPWLKPEYRCLVRLPHSASRTPRRRNGIGSPAAASSASPSPLPASGGRGPARAARNRARSPATTCSILS